MRVDIGEIILFLYRHAFCHFVFNTFSIILTLEKSYSTTSKVCVFVWCAPQQIKTQTFDEVLSVTDHRGLACLTRCHFPILSSAKTAATKHKKKSINVVSECYIRDKMNGEGLAIPEVEDIIL